MMSEQIQTNLAYRIGHQGYLLPFILYVVLTTHIARDFLEKFMFTHMLIQIPLIVFCGGWIANIIINKYSIRIPYTFALTLLIISLTTAMFWMLPKTLDASLQNSYYEFSKFISLPTVLGAAFILGWKNTGVITRSFFVINITSMLIVLAWLYIEAPLRLCNYYLVDEQKQVGAGILLAVSCVSLYWIVRLFSGNKKCS